MDESDNNATAPEERATPQKFDLAGAIEHTYIPTGAPLMPLFEAIDNAIDAVRLAPAADARIVVDVVREAEGPQTNLLDRVNRPVRNIDGFRIEDNGIGFTDEHVVSFMTRYSRLKVSAGGKGLGRFAWFKTFARVDVLSHYWSGSDLKARRWSFNRGDTELGRWHDEAPSIHRSGTIVHLRGFAPEFERKAPRKLETVAYRIVEHFFAHHVLGTLPHIEIREDGVDDSYTASSICSELTVARLSDTCSVEGSTLRLTHLLLRHHSELPGGIVYCAKDRAVEIQSPDTVLPDVPDSFTNEHGQVLSFRTYVSGDLLEANVDPVRTSFRFDPGTSRQRRLYPDAPTWTDLREAMQPSCEKFLEPHVAGARKVRDDLIERHLEDAPWYRGVLAARPELKTRVPLNAGSEAIEMSLYRETLHWRGEVHEKGARLLEELKSEGQDFDELRRKLWEHQVKLKTSALDDLARYVSHRKAVLEWLERYLGFVAGKNSYVKEADVHDLFFRRGKDSDSEGYYSHNLWIIDDQLTFHQYAASDMALSAHRARPVDSRREPDVVTYSRGFFTERDDEDSQCRSVVIVEFKKPGRVAYGSDEDPVQQVRRYAELIATGTRRATTGRTIEVGPGTRYFGYIIADPCPELNEFAKHYSLRPLPNGTGWARHFLEDDPRVYVEMYTYTQALTMAKKRNAAFFQLAGLRGRVET
jgi:hypothetical protein